MGSSVRGASGRHSDCIADRAGIADGSASVDCRADKGRVMRHVVSCVCAGIALGALAPATSAQQRESHVTIPYLANVTTPEALDYAAAQCDIAADDRSMTCRVRQLFITQSSIDATHCAITTNGYEQRFTRESPVRWVSAAPADGTCGIVETTTLEDGGGTRWTMTIASRATKNLEQEACKAAAPPPEVYDWKTIRRRLPCQTIQPGAIER